MSSRQVRRARWLVSSCSREREVGGKGCLGWGIDVDTRVILRSSMLSLSFPTISPTSSVGLSLNTPSSSTHVPLSPSPPPLITRSRSLASHSPTSRIRSISPTNPTSEIPSSVIALASVHLLLPALACSLINASRRSRRGRAGPWPWAGGVVGDAGEGEGSGAGGSVMWRREESAVDGRVCER
ncbi:hypothetical protein B0H34DRAFT_11965 [Crassisporium funariophilum]|nr:hypothetical protein B0H34DRAFT_11965 [Crassisporium funariophilum]